MRLRSSLWPLYKRLLQRSTRPVLVGPFRGEAGLEAIYWVPFVKALGLPPERVIPVTRGGAHLWYDSPRSVELFDLRDPRDVRIENLYQAKRTGMMKQRHVSAFDADVLADAARSLGLTRYLTLHPSWMYQFLAPFWKSQRGLEWVVPHLRMVPFNPVEAEGVVLPPEFVAVRFYARHTFPSNDVNRTVAVETIKHLAKSHPVIVMNANVHTDEHLDFPVPNLPNVIQLKGQSFVTPQNSLATQSAILSKALGFVGTYGGLAHMATMYRKPTVSFYADWSGAMLAHRHLAEVYGMQFGVSCHVFRVTDLPLLRLVLPQMTFHPALSTQASADPVFTGTPELC